tara:strand:- start:1203 stop:1490 length:288 start_codon:yes stop_codon:yes gene_type:complete
MNLTSKALIKNLNDRLLAQSVVVETLIDIILDNNLVTEKELENLLLENHKHQLDYITDIKEKIEVSSPIEFEKELSNEIDESVIERMYFGPVGEA